ncbi:MAG: hypothetical protein ACLFUM_11270, partial [Spirochaetaceae bacterium]
MNQTQHDQHDAATNERCYLLARIHAAEALWRAEEKSGRRASGGAARDCNAPERRDLRPCAVVLLRKWYNTVPRERTRRLLRGILRAGRAVLRVSPLGAVKRLTRRLRGGRGRSPRPEQLLEALREHTPPSEEELTREYREGGLHTVLDTFVLYRIVGNDLYPRHERGQSRANVRFILENEPQFAGCERRWLLNRIVDSEERAAVIDLLERHGEHYSEIDFDAAEFCGTSFDVGSYPFAGYLSSAEFIRLGPEQQQRAYTAAYRAKNNYVMNNNGARNRALEEGRELAKWVLPFDGNCFLTSAAWEEIRDTVTGHPHLRYFVVPMQRITDNSVLLAGDAADLPTAEPQIIFRFDAAERFNEAHPYGRRPK